MTLHGPIVIHKNHILAQKCFHFSITPCLQELICFIGMQHTYNGSCKIFKKLLGIDITSKQIERVCTFYGTKLYEMQCDKGVQPKKQQQKTKILYVMMDGSFVSIRSVSLPSEDANRIAGKDCWKEVKLARLIDAKNIVKGISKDRSYVSHSDYLVHIGTAEPFLEQLRQSIEKRKYDKLVFICDGAKWIWNWVADTFSKAIQILDYFHAMEHIGEHGKIFFDDDVLRKEWINLQQERLLTDGVAEILEELEQEKITANGNISKAKQECLTKTINYIRENSKRMLYKTYKKQSIEIGSGAIESAHRTIIQQRAKLSGQRWTMTGVQSILSLRATYHSGRWEDLINLVKTN